MIPLIIVNPASGRGRARKRLPELKHELATHHLDFEVRVSRRPEDVEDWANEAAESGRPVVGFGGDGLVNMIVNAAAGRSPIGVIPSGVGNDFAAALDLPDDIAEAVDVIAAGAVRRVDLGRVTTGNTSRLYTCIGSAGFDSEANARANRITWMSGTPLYTYAALATLADWRPARFWIDSDAGHLDVPAWLVAVGNGPSYGAGMRVCPEADLADGLLDVTILGDTSKLEFLRTFPKVFSGKHVGHPKVRTFRTKSIRIEADRAFDCYADGEAFAPLPVDIESMPGAAEVLVPSSH